MMNHTIRFFIEEKLYYHLVRMRGTPKSRTELLKELIEKSSLPWKHKKKKLIEGHVTWDRGRSDFKMIKTGSVDRKEDSGILG